MTPDGIGVPLRRREDRRFLSGRDAMSTTSCDRSSYMLCSCARPMPMRRSWQSEGRGAGGARRRGDLHRRGRHRRQAQRRAVRLGHRWKGRQANEGATAPLLARGKVRHIGDPVAMIVADSVDAARSAAERIAIDYRILPAATGVVESH